jgi:hypothetical protein
MVRNTNQSQKDKEEGTSYIHRLCPVMEKLFERERETETERVHGPKKLFQVQRRDDHWLLKKKTVALNAMLLCNKLPLSLSLSILPLT